MAQIISVSMPDDLYQRLQAVKDNIPVSRVCQKAIERAVRVEELRRKEGKNMSKVIERLQTEKEDHDEVYYTEGYEQGRKYAERMKYAELVEISQAQSIHQTEAWQEWLRDEMRMLGKNDPAFNQDRYMDGWMQAVRDFFEDIKGQL